MHSPIFRPLKNLRILDLTRVLAGPYATMLLGDLGAEVIKVEHPVHWDETRTWGPPFARGQDDATYFFAANRNKKSMGLDFSTTHGQDILSRLIQVSDVMVDNFVPGKLEALGITDDFVKNLNRKLVWASISGYGNVGSEAHTPGYAVIMEAFAGMMSVTGPKSGEPVKLGVAWTDIITGMHTDIAILAALSNEPRAFVHIDTSLLNSQISALANVATAYLIGGVEGQRWGADHASIVPYGTFKCSDGHIAVAVGNDRLFRRFCEALEHPGLLEDTRFKTNLDRVKYREVFHSVVDSVFALKPTHYWTEKLEKAKVPVSKVNSIKEVFAQPQVQAAGGLIKSSTGDFTLPGYPFHFRGYSDAEAVTPPTRGQHTDDILKTVLNLSDEEIRRLRDLKIVGSMS